MTTTTRPLTDDELARAVSTEPVMVGGHYDATLDGREVRVLYLWIEGHVRAIDGYKEVGEEAGPCEGCGLDEDCTLREGDYLCSACTARQIDWDEQREAS